MSYINNKPYTTDIVGNEDIFKLFKIFIVSSNLLKQNKYITEHTASERTHIFYCYCSIITNIDAIFIQDMCKIGGLTSRYVLNNPQYIYALTSNSLENLYIIMINWIIRNKKIYGLKEKGFPSRLHIINNPKFEVINGFIIEKI
jgi:hypothetical protein